MFKYKDNMTNRGEGHVS